LIPPFFIADPETFSKSVADAPPPVGQLLQLD
jgi:hypothetical protein